MYIAETVPLQNAELFDFLYCRLPPYRQQKIDRYRFPGGKRLSLGVGALLQAACLEQGIPGADEDILLGEHGKGFFRNIPDAFFSLSHSGERAMCLISSVEAGCDVQKVEPVRWPVAERVFSETEQAWLRQQEKDGRGDISFTRLWALKESFLKMTGEGFSASPEGISVCFTDAGISAQEQRRTRNVFFFEPDLQDGYCYACCLADASPGAEIQIRQYDFTLDLHTAAG